VVNTLGDFLRSRRARIQPEQVGLRPAHGRRRVPGLRREEVAQLAGISVDYYIRLEQGRGQHASDEVLDAVAQVLRLDATEQAHLRALARTRRDRDKPARTRAAEHVRSTVRLMLEAVTGAPAVVVGRQMDILAWNTLGKALHGVHAPEYGLSMPRIVFLDPDSTTFFPDWSAVAAETVAYLRLQAGRRPNDAQLSGLIGDLSVKSDDFRRLWADHLVDEKTHGGKRIRHPLVGDLELEYETLTFPGEDEQSIVVYVAQPGSPTAERLCMLASWTVEPDVPTRSAPVVPDPPLKPDTDHG
jgi:transcriptional regulator with XRE-family HTH domain